MLDASLASDAEALAHRRRAKDALGGTLASRRAEADDAPAAWPEWLRRMFPRHVRFGFADHHGELWDWAWEIEQDSAPVPFVAVWARGGGKSTGAELVATALGIRNRRRYALYVRETQEQADKSVGNIAALLESATVEGLYPAHADRALSKFGNSKGWRRNRLRTAGGFTVDALGLDAASRGVKVEEQRPDLIILDDIDDKHDSPQSTAKKIATITTSILPAGADNVAVLAIQNLIIPHGFFTRLADGRADYLARRIVSGPHPAIRDLRTEWRDDEDRGVRRAMIVAGTPTWAGQDLAVCQHSIDTMGLAAFLKECQHSVRDKPEGVALRYDETRHLEDLSDDECRELVRMGQAFGGIDYGAWRFAFVLRAVDRGGVVHQIAELFSQREGLEQRARIIHAIGTAYGCPPHLRMWGDAANPQDMIELNAAFKRIGSAYRVVAVAGGNKARAASVDRLNDLLDRDAVKYRRSVASHVHGAVRAQWRALEYPGNAPDLRSWMLGYNASSSGTLTEGSRLQWEVENWSYPIPKEGLAQKQDPDDHTADGADAIAADRYGIMSWWKPAATPDAPKVVDPNTDEGLEAILERAKQHDIAKGWEKAGKLERAGTLQRNR